MARRKKFFEEDAWRDSKEFARSLRGESGQTRRNGFGGGRKPPRGGFRR